MEVHDPFAAELESDEPSSLTPHRHDGWTPFARKLFLQVLAETGRVKLACEYCRLSTQSAYALRHRDPVFAAGWDAACELARAPLADALYERAMDGYEETITRDGEVVATRHKFDSRLSIAVLHRLDKRCDRAEEKGARHLPLIDRWDEWLDLIGNGAETEAAAMLQADPQENSPDNQLRQLPLGENPTALDSEDDDALAAIQCGFWQDDEGNWRTDYPAPEGFDGFQQGNWGDVRYWRDCTAEESQLLDSAEKSSLGRLKDQAAALRDAYFAELKAELSGYE